MKFHDYFKHFCETNGYIGKIDYNMESKEYSIVISKGNNNGGAFLTKQEISSLSNEGIMNLLELLDNGFKVQFEHR